MKKTILTLILAAADIALLVMIVVSVKAAGIGPTEMPATAVETVTDEETGATVPEITFPETQTDPETWSDPETQTAPETTEGFTEEEILRDVSAYDTHELPNIKDFKWVTQEILAGNCPEEAEQIYFEESLGGWKCYIMDDATEMERLANMELAGTMEALELRFDWYYLRRGGKDGEAMEDNTPDSVFRGFVNDAGGIEAEGPGMVRVTDIYAIGDHMYAFGTLNWPDGIVGYLFLVRP